MHDLFMKRITSQLPNCMTRPCHMVLQRVQHLCWVVSSITSDIRAPSRLVNASNYHLLEFFSRNVQVLPGVYPSCASCGLSVNNMGSSCTSSFCYREHVRKLAAPNSFRVDLQDLHARSLTADPGRTMAAKVECELVLFDLLCLSHTSRKSITVLPPAAIVLPNCKGHTSLRRLMKTPKSDYTSSCIAGLPRNRSTHLSTVGDLVSAAKVPHRTPHAKQSPGRRRQGPAHLSRRCPTIITPKIKPAVFPSLMHSRLV